MTCPARKCPELKEDFKKADEAHKGCKKDKCQPKQKKPKQAKKKSKGCGCNK